MTIPKLKQETKMITKSLTISVFFYGVTLMLIALLVSYAGLFDQQRSADSDDLNRKTSDKIISSKETREKNEEEKHFPTPQISQLEYMEMLKSVEQIPSENDLGDLPVNSWKSLGPLGAEYPQYGSTRHASGRVRDIEYHPISKLRVASGSGGIWGSKLVVLLYSFWPLSERLPIQTIGSFCTHPTDTSIIFAGTGEPGEQIGLGLYRTSNSGGNWNSVPMSSDDPYPIGFYKIRYANGSTNRIFAATMSGFQVSSNGGTNWSRTFTGAITDLQPHPTDPNIVFITRGYSTDWSYPNGLFKSTNGGLNFVSITPATSYYNDLIDDCKLTIYESNPNFLYLSMATDNVTLGGIYKTTNGGGNWSNITAGVTNIGQTNRNHVITVSPKNSNLVVWGTLRCFWSTNGGNTWNAQDTIHADMTRAVWQDSSRLFLGNDGGIAFSSNGGRSYTTIGLNYLPTVEFYRIEASRIAQGYILGGTQDNGTFYTTNNGVVWKTGIGGDGNAVTIDPTDVTNMFGVAVVNNLTFGTTNTFSNSYIMNTGLDTVDWYRDEMANDLISPVVLYRATGTFLYRSLSPYTSWSKLNASPFASKTLSVGVRKAFLDLDTYVTLNKSTGNDRVKFYNGSFFDRASGLPNGIVRFVAPNPNITNNAVAAMSNSSGDRLYRTTNEGLNWVNITGDFPLSYISYQGIVFHPTDPNTMYVGSGRVTIGLEKFPGFSVFRTTNGGTNWHKWSNGMSDGLIISQMSYIDSTAINGKFYLVAGTFGRSVYAREVAGDDPSRVSVSAAIQGLYNSGTNQLNIDDTLRLYLRNSISPFSIADSGKGILSRSTLLCDIMTSKSNIGSYYLVLKHRNSIETWSKFPHLFTGSSLTYSFTSAIGQAYGNNMKQVDSSPIRYAIYSGDVDQDGAVDATDVSMIDNDAQNFAGGYIVTDLTGDNFVDGTDFLIADNNAANFVSVIRP